MTQISDALSLTQARTRWLWAKTQEYVHARQEYADVPRTALEISKIIRPIYWGLTAYQRRQADRLLPFVRELQSATNRLYEILPQSIRLAQDPPRGSDATEVLVLRAWLDSAVVAWRDAQALLQQWRYSPAAFHSLRTPTWEAYLIGTGGAAEASANAVGAARAVHEAAVGRELLRARAQARQREQEQREADARRAKRRMQAIGVCVGLGALGVLWYAERGIKWRI